MSQLDAQGGTDARDLPILGIECLTRRWIALLPDHPTAGTAFSPVGLWPLLAIIADAATPEVRAGLEEALGDSVPMTETALALLDALRDRGVAVAAGVWLKRALAVCPSFIKGLPAGTVEFLSGSVDADKAAIKTWANRTLQGAIPDLEVNLEEDTAAYLASALLLTLEWERAFTRDTISHRLERTVSEAHTVRASPEVTTVRVGAKGKSAHDVYLVVGRDGSPASSTLGAGLRAIVGGLEPLNCESAQTQKKNEYPGLRIEVRVSRVPRTEPWVKIKMPSFRVTENAELDLKMCGLPPRHRSVDCNDFPGIASNAPLEVYRVNQQAVVEFDEIGFKAAAYSQVRVCGSRAEDTAERFPDVYLNIDIEGPFGFFVVDRDSGILLFTGWVTEKEWTAPPRKKAKRSRSEIS